MMAGPTPLDPRVLALLANPANRAEAFATGSEATYAGIPKVDWQSYKNAQRRQGRNCGPGYRWVPDMPGVPSPQSARDTLTEVRWSGILRSPTPEDGFPAATLQRRPNVPRGYPLFDTPVTSLAARRKQYSRETVSTINGFALLSALEPQTEVDLRTLVAALDAAAKQVEAAQPGAISSWWQSLIGAESAGAGIRSVAHSQRVLANTIAAKAANIAKAGDEAAARQLIKDAVDGKWTDVATTLKTAQYISASGGATEIGTGILKDTAKLAEGAGQGWTMVFKYAPYIGVGLIGIALWRFASKAGGGAGRAMETAAQNLTTPAAQSVGGLSRHKRRRRR
jgi:hypothetical protein